MKKITLLFVFLLMTFYLSSHTFMPGDTTFHYNDRKVVITESDKNLHITVYHQNEEGDTIQSEKIYEGIYTEERNIERQYENTFEISIPDIFMPKKKRRPSSSHWAGFGVGFANFNSDELSSIINSSRSLQYNLNLIEGSRRIGNSNLTVITGMGIQFNAIHFQNNKAAEVENYKTIITTTLPGDEYRRSRLHYTYLTFPLLFESNWRFGGSSHLFLNAGVVAKVKTASSSKIWKTVEDGTKEKTKLPGDLNIRPVTLDLIAQCGISDLGFFVSHSPFSLFRDDKGPVGNQTTIGLQLYF